MRGVRRHHEKRVWRSGGSTVTGPSELPSPWLGRKGSGDRQGLLFGIDDVNELRLEGSTAHKEAIHIRLACQLLAGCPRHRTWEGRQEQGVVSDEMGVLHTDLQVEGGLGLVLSPPHLRLEPNPLTPINDAGALSHCIRDVGLKPSPELFVYFLGLEQEARLRPSLTGEKTLGSSGDRQCGLRARTLGLRSHTGPGMCIPGQVTLFSLTIYLVLTCSMQD